MLLAVGPRLVPHPRARVHISSMTWVMGGDKSLPAYLQRSFGGSPSLLPSLTGLRLCTDTRFGSLEPYSMHHRVVAPAANTRYLQFAPAVASAGAMLAMSLAGSSSGNSHDVVTGGDISSSRSGSGESCQAADIASPVLSIPPEVRSSSPSRDPSLSEALLRLQDLCCLQNAMRSGAMGCEVELQTSASLARLIAAACLSGRVQLQLPGSNSSSSSRSDCAASSDSSSSSCVWQQLTQVVTAWTALPQGYQLAWRATWAWLLQAAPAPAPASAPAGPSCAAGGPSDAPSKLPGSSRRTPQQQQLPPPRPLVFTGYMQPNSGSGVGHMCPTPELAVLLITESAAPAIINAPVFGDSMGAGGAGMLQAMQWASAAGQLHHMSMIPAFMHACGLWVQGKDVPAAAADGVSVLDNIVVVPDPEHPQTKPMKVCW